MAFCGILSYPSVSSFSLPFSPLTPISPTHPRFTKNGYGQVLDTNLVGPFLVAQAVARSMVRDKRTGSIINISSVSSMVPSSGKRKSNGLRDRLENAMDCSTFPPPRRHSVLLSPFVLPQRNRAEDTGVDEVCAALSCPSRTMAHSQWSFCTHCRRSLFECLKVDKIGGITLRQMRPLAFVLLDFLTTFSSDQGYRRTALPRRVSPISPGCWRSSGHVTASASTPCVPDTSEPR